MLIFYCKMPSRLIFGMVIPFCQWTLHETLEESRVSWGRTMVLSKEEYIHFAVNLRDFFSCIFLSVPNTFTLEALVRTPSFIREIPL